MEEMKITVLVNYLKETGFHHTKNKNISIELKQKIYESYYEKIKTMSKNSFCKYLKPFGIGITSIKEIINIGDKNKPNSLSFNFWHEYEENNYKQRYKKTSRSKNIEKLTQKQESYIIELRENEPNKGYKLFENGLFIPENKQKFKSVFGVDFVLSKRLFYNVINKNNLPHRITKWQKI